MNRDVNGESDPLSKQQTPSSSYLVYLLLLSAGFIVVLPYLFPSSGLLSRTGSRTEEGRASLQSERRSSYKRASPAPSSYPTLYTNDYFRKYESKCESLEIFVMDLQRVVHAERERTMHLENEIRVLQISENFLKERVQYLEERNWDYRKEGTSSDSLLRNMPHFAASDARKGSVPDTLVHDLLRMVQVERDRTSSLQSEIRLLQRSEMSLQSRIEKLEEQFASTCKEPTTKDSKKGK